VWDQFCITVTHNLAASQPREGRGQKKDLGVSLLVGLKCTQHCMFGLDVTCPRGPQVFLALPISLTAIPGWRYRGDKGRN
jgi:hypothetical protein